MNTGEPSQHMYGIELKSTREMANQLCKVPFVYVAMHLMLSHETCKENCPNVCKMIVCLICNKMCNYDTKH